MVSHVSDLDQGPQVVGGAFLQLELWMKNKQYSVSVLELGLFHAFAA